MATVVPDVSSCRAGTSAPAVRRRVRAGVAIVLLGCCAIAQALAPDRALSQLRHDRWTPEQGAPAQIMSIAQTPDGFLWLGSRQGLYRFDGMRFERVTRIAGVPIVDDDILSLFVDTDGSVWVGYVSGGMSRMGGPHAANYAYQREDVPLGSVIGFGRDASGRLWAATSTAVVFLDPASDTWKSAASLGFDPAWMPQRLFFDRDKGMWVAYSREGTAHIAHLAPHATSFETVPPSIEYPFFDQAPDGTLWAADEWGVRPLAQAVALPGRAAVTASWLAPDFRGAGLRFDRDGGMWLVGEHGIARVRDPARLRAPDRTHAAPSPAYFGTAEGLTSEVVWTLFEDREGNLWAGTANGLDRFRSNALAAITLPRRDQVFSIAVDGSGQVWAANADKGPMRITPDPDQPGGARVQEIAGAQAGVTAMHRDGAGTLWVGDANGGLWRGEGAALRPVPWPPEFAAGGAIVTLASDRDGGLWVSKIGGGLLRRDRDGHWAPQNAAHGLSAGGTPRALAQDAEGRLWSDAGQTVRVLTRGGHHDFDDDGPQIGRIAVLRAWKHEVWMGGVRGVAARIDGRFQRLLGRGGEHFERTAGMVMLADGEAWFIGRPGVTRVAASEMARWRAQPSYAVAFERFGVLDGLRGAVEQSGASPVAVADDQGRVWFATSRGVHWIDVRAQARRAASVPMAPAILAVRADDKEMPLAAAISLPQASRDLRIDYTVPLLGRPEQARFRYRLEGLDTDWQAAGARRQALYSRLAPGRYRFRLQAGDGGAAWSAREAALTFDVPPAFWQTWWFALACLLALLAAVWALVRWRVAAARAGVQRIYRARIVERERIARDLHDTLLQSMQALMFMVEAARGRLERGEEEAAKAGLSRVVAQANAGLVEGRERIRELRQASAEPQDLEARLGGLPEKLALPAEIAYAFAARGKPLRWTASEQDEVYRIVREAVANAVRHARARNIRVTVAYGWLGVVVEVRDDGCGMDAALLAGGNREGHWGLVGMRERAGLLGARLSVTSRPGQGTTVRLRLPRWRAARRAGP